MAAGLAPFGAIGFAATLPAALGGPVVVCPSAPLPPLLPFLQVLEFDEDQAWSCNTSEEKVRMRTSIQTP